MSGEKLDMVPVECVVRNRAAGSLVKRLGIEEGIELNPPLFDLFLKNDAMHDPMVNDSYCETFGWVSKENLARMRELTYKANDVLKKLFDDAGLILVDFKLEFGLFKGEVVLGDEFSPDGSRLWDKNTLDKMDKDRFRQSLGGLIEAYRKWLTARALSSTNPPAARRWPHLLASLAVSCGNPALNRLRSLLLIHNRE